MKKISIVFTCPIGGGDAVEKTYPVSSIDEGKELALEKAKEEVYSHFSFQEQQNAKESVAASVKLPKTYYAIGEILSIGEIEKLGESEIVEFMRECELNMAVKTICGRWLEADESVIVLNADMKQIYPF